MDRYDQKIRQLYDLLKKERQKLIQDNESLKNMPEPEPIVLMDESHIEKLRGRIKDLEEEVHSLKGQLEVERMRIEEAKACLKK